jgi:hypothetical protein
MMQHSSEDNMEEDHTAEAGAICNIFAESLLRAKQN